MSADEENILNSIVHGTLASGDLTTQNATTAYAKGRADEKEFLFLTIGSFHPKYMVYEDGVRYLTCSACKTKYPCDTMRGLGVKG